MPSNTCTIFLTALQLKTEEFLAMICLLWALCYSCGAKVPKSKPAGISLGMGEFPGGTGPELPTCIVDISLVKMCGQSTTVPTILNFLNSPYWHMDTT